MENFTNFADKHATGFIVTLTTVSLVLFGVKRWMAGASCRSKARLEGKTVLVTGANTGIGRETALDMARRGARVILACRDETKAQTVADQIRQETGNGNVAVKKLDLASLKSVRDLAQDLNRSEERLDVLINNAGVCMCPKWETEDGFEMQFGVNHLGHFLLTNCLLDLLKKSAPSRVVIVSSLAHEEGRIHFDDINLDKDYDKDASYSQSKLANVMFGRELARRLRGTGVTAYSLHPGVIMTELGRHLYPTMPLWQKVLAVPFTKMLKTPEQGAQTTIFCAVDESLEGVSGRYYSNCCESAPGKQALDDAVAERLWDLSASMVGLTATI